MPYHISEEAESDLDQIFLYWANRAGLQVADRIIDNITDRFWLLGEYPDAGRASNEIAPGIRCFPAGKYLIYYRKTSSGTDIVHIFHGAQHQQRAFKKARYK